MCFKDQTAKQGQVQVEVEVEVEVVNPLYYHIPRTKFPINNLISVPRSDVWSISCH